MPENSTTPPLSTDQIVERDAAVQRILRDYHFALDNREHGDLAKYHAIQALQDLYKMHWHQGKEAARREALNDAALGTPNPAP